MGWEMSDEEKKQRMQKLQDAAVALAIVYGVYKFGKYDFVKAAALGVGGVVVAKNLPFVSKFV
jgi:hypothetical protein